MRRWASAAGVLATTQDWVAEGEGPSHPAPALPRPYLLLQAAISANTGVGKKWLDFMQAEIFRPWCGKGSRSSGLLRHWAGAAPVQKQPGQESSSAQHSTVSSGPQLWKYTLQFLVTEERTDPMRIPTGNYNIGLENPLSNPARSSCVYSAFISREPDVQRG